MIVTFENPKNLLLAIEGLIYEGIPFKVKKIRDEEYISVVRTYWVLEDDYERYEGEEK